MVGGERDDERSRKWGVKFVSPLHAGGNTQNMMVFVDDVDAHCEHARKSGREDHRRAHRPRLRRGLLGRQQLRRRRPRGPHVVVHAAPAQPEVSSVDGTLAALSDPTRRAVVELLRRKPLRAGEIAEALEITPPALSRHLRVLRRAGLIVDDEPEHDARVRLYRLNPKRSRLSRRGWARSRRSGTDSSIRSRSTRSARRPRRKR
jgi:DNA-binding transcriptional ArsR family regulator